MENETTIITWAIAIRRALNARNISAEDVFRDAGLDISALKDPDGRYPVKKMSRLWELAVDASADEDFALSIPSHVQPGTLHGLGLALMASKTLGEGLKRLERFSHIVSTAANVVTYEEPDSLVVEYFPVCPVAPQAMQAFLATTLQFSRLMIQDPMFKVGGCQFKCDKPTSTAPYNEFFGCDVEFNQSRWALLVGKDVLDMPVPFANATLAAANDEVVSRYLAELQDNVVDMARQAILEALATGLPSVEDIAEKLNLSPRSLQRQLNKADNGFIRLREDVQRELAIRWVSQSQRSFAEITFRLGFNDQSYFGKTFKKWTGKTPREYREETTNITENP